MIDILKLIREIDIMWLWRVLGYFHWFYWNCNGSILIFASVIDWNEWIIEEMMKFILQFSLYKSFS